MTTEQLLQEAIEKVQEARELIERAKENESLDEYYGYSIQIIDQEFDRFCTNEKCYMGRNTSLEEIVEGMYEGNWENKEHDED
jgi:hypothetical protein